MQFAGYKSFYTVKNNDGEYIGKNNAKVGLVTKAIKYKEKQKAVELAKRMNQRSAINQYKVVKVHVAFHEEEIN